MTTDFLTTLTAVLDLVLLVGTVALVADAAVGTRQLHRERRDQSEGRLAAARAAALVSQWPTDENGGAR